jgi:predicted GNAT family N-acyltransferase
MAADPARPFAVRVTDWAGDQAGLRAVRTAVFVVEQAIAPELEWDEVDPVSVHALAEAGGTPIGCGRLLPDGHIGRMAVLAAWRGQGVGAALLVRLIERARTRGDPQAILNAQTQAMPFYARHGFAPTGDEFLEADIPHRVMVLALR